MNPEQLRHNLRQLWLTYYRDNRHWLSRMEIWITHKDQRRPSSSFILATISVLNPELTQILPLLADLNSDPDQMVEALGLNFNPERLLGTLPEGAALPGQEVASHRLPSAAAPSAEMGGRHFFQQRQPASVPTGTAQSADIASNPGDGHRPIPPSPDQVLQRPPRPIPRSGGNQPTTEVTRRANEVDSICEGRDLPRPLPPRPRRKFTA
ncbi:MAG: DUF5331 domain-containing protein [Cyanobacteria bacterium P01_F01_bin.153]